MNYYIVNQETNQILEVCSHYPSDEELESDVESFRCAIYVIKGEHTGLTMEPTPRMRKAWVNE